ncbi:hypothetical protein J2T04_002289 [Chryseobacterium lathyri]|uniref:Uncharacterized protein n=1 Tax=Chryseobacterium lathyri TaxID=395933 RepID=A0ABT9SPQ3_9FLAO|nr:hypothetical protein [Chryseobacterium lathyri]
MILQFQRACTPPFEFKQYSIWDDVSLILILSAYLILYVGGAYLFMRGLKLGINALKKHFEKEKC